VNTRKHMIGLLAGSAMRMTPAEARAGRFLRSPDGHDGGAAPAAAPSAAPASAEAPAAPAAPAAPPTDAMAALELEMGDVVLPGSKLDEGTGAKASEEPGVSDDGPKDDLAAELEAERHRANTAEEALRAAKATKGTEPPKDDATPGSTEDSDPAPKVEDYEFGAADENYLADWSRWNARQEFVSLRAKEALTAELNTIEDGWKATTGAEEFKAEYPDFDEVVTKGAAEERWECTPLMALAIKASPIGGHVAYELAKNPAEAARIAKLIPVEQAYELGRLEGRVGAGRAAKTAPEPKVTSSAPPPPASRSRGSGGQYTSELSSVQDRMLKEFR
jgi:hypothetical protein